MLLVSNLVCAAIGAAFGFWLAAIITSTRTKKLQARFERLQKQARHYVLAVREDQRAEEG